MCVYICRTGLSRVKHCCICTSYLALLVHKPVCVYGAFKFQFLERFSKRGYSSGSTMHTLACCRSYSVFLLNGVMVVVVAVVGVVVVVVVMVVVVVVVMAVVVGSIGGDGGGGDGGSSCGSDGGKCGSGGGGSGGGNVVAVVVVVAVVMVAVVQRVAGAPTVLSLSCRQVPTLLLFSAWDAPYCTRLAV